MKYILYILIIAVFIFFGSAQAQVAQIENVIVETYYISDSADATDTSGGRVLLEGSTTYRVYVDLVPGAKIKSIYGDVNHALRFASDSLFYKNINAPQKVKFGYQINKPWITTNRDNPLLALDTWLTIGLATKVNPGILKAEDPNGSLLGGTLNDGGSEFISGGILVNDDPAAGIPLVSQDGLAPNVTGSLTWQNFGFADSCIFGIDKIDSVFLSYEALLEQTSGTKGSTPDNKVLVAQLTTRGKLSFELNLEIIDSITGNTIRYVAKNGADSASITAPVKLSSYLKYPPECGCMDPNYAEYKATYGCDRANACVNRVVFGCMDTLACNYDPRVNYNVQTLCCYPGYCNGRDLSIVCPGISSTVGFNVYPNPAQEKLTLEILANGNQEIKYAVFDSFGVQMLEKSLGILLGTVIEKINLSGFNNGLYLMRVTVGKSVENKLFMKK